MSFLRSGCTSDISVSLSFPITPPYPMQYLYLALSRVNTHWTSIDWLRTAILLLALVWISCPVSPYVVPLCSQQDWLLPVSIAGTSDVLPWNMMSSDGAVSEHHLKLFACDCLCEAVGFWLFQISAQPKRASTWDISDVASWLAAFCQSLAFFLGGVGGLFPAERGFHET